MLNSDPGTLSDADRPYLRGQYDLGTWWKGRVQVDGYWGRYGQYRGTGTGQRWGLSLADRVLLVAVYYRTNLTYRQVALLFGISKSAAGRVVDHLTPLLALAPIKRGPRAGHRADRGRNLVPTHDRNMSVSSKNYRYSVHMQVVIDAITRLTVAVGHPHQVTAMTAGPTRDSEVDQQMPRRDLVAQGCQHVRRHGEVTGVGQR